MLARYLRRASLQQPPSVSPCSHPYRAQVRFFRDGAWRVVVVDDWLPCNAAGRPLFCWSAGAQAALWYAVPALPSSSSLSQQPLTLLGSRPALVEKAYAKLGGGYEAIIGGQESEALADLTGGVPRDLRLRCAPWDDEEALWQEVRAARVRLTQPVTPSSTHSHLLQLLACHRRGHLVCCSTDRAGADVGEEPRGVLPGHAYAVVCAVDVSTAPPPRDAKGARDHEQEGQAARPIRLLGLYNPVRRCQSQP